LLDHGDLSHYRSMVSDRTLSLTRVSSTAGKVMAKQKQ